MLGLNPTLRISYHTKTNGNVLTKVHLEGINHFIIPLMWVLIFHKANIYIYFVSVK